jgi:hypothetical protein
LPSTLIVLSMSSIPARCLCVLVTASGLISGLSAADPNYLALRNDTVAGSYQVKNLVLKRDAGTFTFQSGSFSFGHPVLGKRVFAVFIGDGNFHLTPVANVEADHLKVVTGARELDENFHSVVLCFTDITAKEIMASSESTDDSPVKASAAFRDFRNLVRDHSDQPRGRMEAQLSGEDAINVDAELLRELYTPGHESFSAYIHGTKHSDLRFFVNPAGALPQLLSPEEVALFDAEPQADYEGVLYMSHLQPEWEKRTASSLENHRWAQAGSYKIDTRMGSRNHLTATAVVRMKILTEGTRVVKFGLLPSLRVESVKLAGDDITFIQEPSKQDGSFYLIFPEPMKAGNEADVTIAYAGGDVIDDEGGGSYAVGARTSWYPSLNSFMDRATYDLMFHTPKQFTLVSVGKPDAPVIEKDGILTHWVSDIPLAVAGFNFGVYKKLAKPDEVSGYQIEVYTTEQAPAYLSNSGMTLDPAAMAKNTLIDAENSIRTYEFWFGKVPYGRIAITQQPQFNFGQSWPTLVYLPVSAFLDRTQRTLLMGRASFKFASFIDEVTPHEVAHQWWGHQVGWASYHDQWLSEGFADFSAALFMQATMKSDDVDKYWERQRQRILDRNEFGARANDAGPLWMGQRLNWKKNDRAYSKLVYSKGAYVLQMLKTLMWDPQTKDKSFEDMMHEFVATGGNASTESFAALATKYMKPAMDLYKDKTLNWFFREWVYGTDIPHYALEYSVKPSSAGKFTINGKLSQSEVSDGFVMSVPLYAETPNKQLIRLGLISVAGNGSNAFTIELPFKPVRVAANALHEVLATDTVNREVQ